MNRQGQSTLDVLELEKDWEFKREVGDYSSNANLLDYSNGDQDDVVGNALQKRRTVQFTSKIEGIAVLNKGEVFPQKVANRSSFKILN